MLKIILFAIIVSIVYRQIDSEQQRQGGKPLIKSPVIIGGCGFLILFMALLLIYGYSKGRF